MLKSITHKMKNGQLRRIVKQELALLGDKLLTDIGASRNTLGDYVAGRSAIGASICP